MTEAAKVPAVQAPPSLLVKMASRFSVEPNKMLSTLRATAFRGEVSNEQMMALLIVADQYGLNPWTKEIYAFPDKNNGIVPVVGVDGWSRIINEHEQFDGLDFEQDNEKCKCTIYRKDRAHPIAVTEYMEECRRDIGPWKSHPRRMLRHKALIQCARLAFGYTGIYDQDEAERIIERDITPVPDLEPAPVDSGVRRLKGRLKPKEEAKAKPSVPASATEATVVDHIAKLDELATGKEVADYGLGLPEAIRSDERYMAAAAKRLAILDGQ